jgi:hypothetical protein
MVRTEDFTRAKDAIESELPTSTWGSTAGSTSTWETKLRSDLLAQSAQGCQVPHRLRLAGVHRTYASVQEGTLRMGSLYHALLPSEYWEFIDTKAYGGGDNGPSSAVSNLAKSMRRFRSRRKQTSRILCS